MLKQVSLNEKVPDLEPNNACRGYVFPIIKYYIKENCCYFVILNALIGTPMYGQKIVTEICMKERIHFSNLRFFEITTYRQSHHLPGNFEVEEMFCMGSCLRDIELSWKETCLPPDIFPVFSDLIGKDLAKMHDAVVARESNGLYCLIDKNDDVFYVHPDGRPISNQKFRDAGSFHGGLVWVAREGDFWAQMDMRGRIVSEWIEGGLLF